MNFTNIKGVGGVIDVSWHASSEAVVVDAEGTYWKLFHRYKVKNQPYKQVWNDVREQIDIPLIFSIKNKISREIKR